MSLEVGAETRLDYRGEATGVRQREICRSCAASLEDGGRGLRTAKMQRMQL